MQLHNPWNTRLCAAAFSFSHLSSAQEEKSYTQYRQRAQHLLLTHKTAHAAGGGGRAYAVVGSEQLYSFDVQGSHSCGTLSQRLEDGERTSMAKSEWSGLDLTMDCDIDSVMNLHPLLECFSSTGTTRERTHSTLPICVLSLGTYAQWMLQMWRV